MLDVPVGADQSNFLARRRGKDDRAFWTGTTSELLGDLDDRGGAGGVVVGAVVDRVATRLRMHATNAVHVDVDVVHPRREIVELLAHAVGNAAASARRAQIAACRLDPRVALRLYRSCRGGPGTHRVDVDDAVVAGAE